MLPTWLLYLLSPIGRYAALAALGLALYGAWDLHIRYDERAKIKQTEQVERTNAVKKATVARTRTVKRFDAGRVRNDGFARD
jgi:hypothetical protein